MDRVADTLVANGAECIIMGCTEIPLVMKSRTFCPNGGPVVLCRIESVRCSERKHECERK